MTHQESEMAGLIEITEGVISTDEVVARVADPANGAVVTFVGIVRGITGERETLYLEYEAYPEMAEKVLLQIADEIRARWTDIRAAAIVHRIGRLEIGETAVVIALAAPHRAQTFDALRYAIDRIKEIAPIWKKEFWADGAEWRSEHTTPSR
jgi:molybdopterin synthase catalytic subunit